MAKFTYSENGYALTKQFEGLELKSYKDTGGRWTIGYGHTGPGIVRGMVIDTAQAESLLVADVAWAVACVNKAITAPINQNQFDALVDFTFNLGCLAFTTSKLLQMVNAGKFEAAASEFMRWNKVKGKPLAGLTKRRFAESVLFRTKPIESASLAS